MSETVNANGLQALAGKPSPNSRATDTGNISGTYQRLYQSGFDHQEIGIYEASGGLEPVPSFVMRVQDTDNWASPLDNNSNGQYATFKSNDGSIVAHASLFQPIQGCIVILFYHLTPGRPGHAHHPGDQTPTGVWIGMSSGGTCPPPVDC